MYKYKYSQGWFINSEIRAHLFNFLDFNNKNSILEIGSFEGLSSVFFADNFLNHSESSLICVDPFLNIDDNDHKLFLMNNQEKNFDHNISICDNVEKITVMKITSDEFFKNNTKKFNFIYVDGCHELDYIKRDVENSFNALENNGIMWMDDYRGGDGFNIKNTIDSTLEKFIGLYSIIHMDYQLAIRKH